MFKHNLLTLMLISATLFAVSCKKKESPTAASSQQPQQEAAFDAGSNTDMLTLRLESDPETLDPGKMSGAPEGRVAFNLFEGLFTPGPTTENLTDSKQLVTPGVAKAFTISPDGKTYTFTLRDDAKWSDGKPVTAKDFLYAWKRVLTPGFPGDYAQLLWVIDGAEAYSSGKTNDFNTVGVKAIDDKTLEVKLAHPTPYFPELVAFYTFFPLREDIVEKYGDDWTRPEHIVTNGAYTLAAYEPQKEFLFKKSPYYWDKGSVAEEQVKFKIISDPNAVVNAYKTGELYATGSGLPIGQISSLLTHPDFRQDPLLGTYFFRVNLTKDTPLKDPKVRQALSEAIDRTTLAENTLNGTVTPALSIVPPMAGWSEPSGRKGYQIKHAKELLAEAGFPNGKGFPEITFLYNTSENHKVIAEAIQDMWKRNLGINVKLVNKEWKTYIQDVDNGNFDIARAGWVGDYNDPSTFLQLWTSKDGNNHTGFSDPEYDSIMAESQAEVDPAKRKALLEKAEAIIFERGPVLPLYYYTSNSLIGKRLKGYEPNNRDLHLLKYMSVDKK